MYPHERSLVARFKDRPFVIIGVNSDRDRAKLKERMKEENITWRSFWDGGSTSGPIASRWNVQGWPTLYVVDAKGTIRAHNVRGEPLEAWIEKLVAEAERATTQEGESGAGGGDGAGTEETGAAGTAGRGSR